MGRRDHGESAGMGAEIEVRAPMRTWVDWMPEITYWVEDGQPDPNVDWPEEWEVCGVPDRNPLGTEGEDVRYGRTTLAWPMYYVLDPVEELGRICSFLERMPPAELEKWLALQDRQLKFSCGDPEMDAADIDARGFQIPGPLIQRIRHLRIQLTIGFHPAAEVIYSGFYGISSQDQSVRKTMRTAVDWGPQLVYWVEDGQPDPHVEWPEDWEVCGSPQKDPLTFGDKDKRRGNICLAMPMYSVEDPVQELQRICSFLERMPDEELQNWLALQDRQLTFRCSDPDMDAATMNTVGFDIPGPVLQRVRRLRIRLMIGFHPAADVIQNVVH